MPTFVNTLMAWPPIGRLRSLYLRYPAALLLAGSLLYYLTYFNYGLDLDDEGFLLWNAASILRGQWPMADFFSYQPLGYFVLAAAFKLLGEGVLTERILLLLLLLINIRLLLFVARRVLPLEWAAVPVVLYAVAPGPWYKVFFMTHMLTIAAAALWYVERPGWRRAAVMGLAGGVALVSRYEAAALALPLFLGTVAVVTLRGWLPSGTAAGQLRAAGRILTGGIAGLLLGWLPVPLLMVAAYRQAGKLADLVANIDHYYFVHSANIARVVEGMGIESAFDPASLFRRPSAEQWFYALALVSVCSVLAAGSAGLFRGDAATRDMAVRRTVLAACALGTMGYTIFFVWNSRMLSSFALVYVVHVVALRALAPRLSSWRPAAARCAPILGVAVLSAFILSFTKVQNYSGAITTRFSGMAAIDHPLLRGVRIYADQVTAIEEMANRVRTTPNGSIVAMSEATTMGYLSGLENPTYYRLFTTEFAPPGEEDRAIRTIEALGVDWLVARRRQFLPGGGLGSDLASYAPRMRDYLIANYRVIPLGERFVLLQRKGK